MSNRKHSIQPTPQPSPDPANWHRHVCREVVYIAGLLRVYSDRLELLADALPLPDYVTANRILEAADEETFRAHPGFSFHVDLGALAHDLKDVAGKLEESAESHLPEEGGDDD